MKTKAERREARREKQKRKMFQGKKPKLLHRITMAKAKRAKEELENE